MPYDNDAKHCHYSCQISCKVGDVITVNVIRENSDITTSSNTEFTQDFKVVGKKKLASKAYNDNIPDGYYPLVQKNFEVVPQLLLHVRVVKIKKISN